MARKLSKSQQSEQTEQEAPGVYRFGQTGTPGHDGPYPGPWFMLEVQGRHFRGRYVEPHVWVCDTGERLSVLESRLHRERPDERTKSPQEVAAMVQAVASRYERA